MSFYFYSCSSFIVAPISYRYNFPCCPVYNFPPSLYIISAVRGEHIRIEALHKINLKNLLSSCISWSHYIHLLDFIRICLGPGIVFSSGIVSRIYLKSFILKFYRKVCTVAVSDGISSPSLC